MNLVYLAENMKRTLTHAPIINSNIFCLVMFLVHCIELRLAGTIFLFLFSIINVCVGLAVEASSVSLV